MGEEAERLIGSCYPAVESPDGTQATPIAWIWVRTVESPDPAWSGHVPLVGSWVLSKKPRKPVVWVEPIVDTANRSIRYEVRKGGTPTDGTVGRSGGRCLATGTPIPLQYIRDEAKAGRLGNALIAVVAEGNRERLFCNPPSGEVEVPAPDLTLVPEGRLPDGGLGFRVQNYGMTEWKALFTPRQMLALTTFGGLLEQVRSEAEQAAITAGLPNDEAPLAAGGEGAQAYAEAIVTYLALIVDRCAGRWTHLAIWNSVRDTVEHVFRLQAMQMTWAFAEANPFSSSTGNWAGQIEWVTKALLTLPLGQVADVAQRDARARIVEKAPFMLSTDPPYYDNVGYADLSDFFYVWMRKNLRDIWPDECATLLTPKADELIADPSRAGSGQAAFSHFEQGMGEVFAAASRSADPGFPSTIFYAFKASETNADGTTSTGWETFLSGLLDSGYAITATWPMRTEMPGGVRNAGRNSLASSVVLACRPRQVSASMATRGEFVAALRQELEPAVRLLQRENIAPVDLAQSAMGPGIAIFSRYAKVVEADGSSMKVRTALALINEVLAEVLSGEESEFDADSRFALTWFEQFGHNPGPFGDADLLARAKNTTVEGVVQAGVVVSRDGKVRLVDRGDLTDEWDPATDTRLTVWETTQHLIRALDSSETEAAALLARLGEGVGERARQLAYLLYGICDRKKWADEAGAYNMLVTAWPELARLAALPAASAGTESLF
jgi:putative DNA methylase